MRVSRPTCDGSSASRSVAVPFHAFRHPARSRVRSRPRGAGQLRADPARRGEAREARPEHGAARSGVRARRDDRGVNLLGDAAGGIAPSRAVRSRRDAGGPDGRGPAARTAPARHARRFPAVDRSVAQPDRRLPRERYPILAGLAQRCASFEREIAEIRRAIDPAGDVLDNASPELRRFATNCDAQRSRLRGTLESYVRGKDTSRYLQDSVVTDRNGRYVLVVQGRASRIDSRASSTAAPPAARASTSSRSPRSN